ncbi:MAG: Holliday junction resolvase RuvX [Synergistaceae bacterium]|nr:Holliday junction resolvase RuvX [Synergistaceae bacterium]
MTGSDIHKRIIALDVGSVRIGVAASDPLGTFAQAVAVLRADGAWMEELSGLLEEYGAEKILIGMPVRTDGTEGPEADKMKKIIASLRERFSGFEIIPWDERFTTTIATQALLEADVSRAGRKRYVDKIAAALLLQSYLDSGKTKPTGVPEDACVRFTPPSIGKRERRKSRRGYD